MTTVLSEIGREQFGSRWPQPLAQGTYVTAYLVYPPAKRRGSFGICLYLNRNIYRKSNNEWFGLLPSLWNSM